MSAINTITTALANTPLPTMIESLAMAIVRAQAALDKNSIDTLVELSKKEALSINGKSYNLLALGFVPTFYAFTEASMEAKIDFSMTESKSFEVGGNVDVKVEAVAVAVTANYARKFEQSAQGSSAISTRLVSLPPPDTLLQLLKSNDATAKLPPQ